MPIISSVHLTVVSLIITEYSTDYEAIS